MTTPLPLSLLGCVFVLTAANARAEDAPPQVTTDSPAYCLQLHERVESLRRAATAPPPREVAELAAEGRRMCDSGLIRGGVMRLRRALTILMHPDEEQR